MRPTAQTARCGLGRIKGHARDCFVHSPRRQRGSNALYHPFMAIGPVRRTLQRLGAKDPDRDGLRRAIRAAIVVPLAAELGRVVVGGTATPLFRGAWRLLADGGH